MPLPIIAVLALGAAGAAAAAKGAASVRRWMNKGETIRVPCRRCSSEGPHEFVTIDRSWAGAVAIGMLVGGFGGAVAGAVARRIFGCKSCGAAMYEDGAHPGWNADEAIQAFFTYPSLKEACETLQELVARNQTVAKKHSTEIERLEQDLQSVKSDKAELERRVRALIEQLQRESM